jgi:hypothetical protein
VPEAWGSTHHLAHLDAKLQASMLMQKHPTVFQKLTFLYT